MLLNNYSLWSQKVFIHVLLFKSHNLIVLSSLPLNTNLELGEKHAVLTQFKWPKSEYWNFIFFVDQILILLSSDAVKSDFPSLENCTVLTADVWALNTATSPLLMK